MIVVIESIVGLVLLRVVGLKVKQVLPGVIEQGVNRMTQFEESKLTFMHYQQ